MTTETTISILGCLTLIRWYFLDFVTDYTEIHWLLLEMGGIVKATAIEINAFTFFSDGKFNLTSL